eukprot:3791040-Pleurochrysis_carterae.AAC.2
MRSRIRKRGRPCVSLHARARTHARRTGITGARARAQVRMYEHARTLLPPSSHASLSASPPSPLAHAHKPEST